MARPITAEQQATILEARAKGRTLMECAEDAGVGYGTVRRVLEEPDPAKRSRLIRGDEARAKSKAKPAAKPPSPASPDPDVSPESITKAVRAAVNGAMKPGEALQVSRELGIPIIPQTERPAVRPSLTWFVRQAWPIVCPDRLEWGAHLDAICQHLEAVADGGIQRLIITGPPRSSKSLLVSVIHPAWLWTTNHAERVFSASHDLELATEHSLASRRLIQSQWYRERWPGVAVTTDQAVKRKFDLVGGGGRIATAVGASPTGKGGTLLIGDDLSPASAAWSSADREDTNRWYRTAFSSRLNDQRTGRVVLVGQRVHTDDLIGELIGDGGWTELRLPVEAPAEPWRTPIWVDTRREGELLARYTPQVVEELRATAGPHAWAAQYAQAPMPDSGLTFPKCPELVDAPPSDWVLVGKCRYWDLAGTKPHKHNRDPDWTVGALLGRYRTPASEDVYLIEDIKRLRDGPVGVEAAIVSTAEADGPTVIVREEQQIGVAGDQIIAARRKLLPGYVYGGDRVTGPKPARHAAPASQASAGKLLAVRGDWNAALMTELRALPGGRHDDQADAVAGGWHVLARHPGRQAFEAVVA